MNLTLIRHGKTEGNLKNLYYGSTNLPPVSYTHLTLPTMLRV